jgi:hypothetical protein
VLQANRDVRRVGSAVLRRVRDFLETDTASRRNEREAGHVGAEVPNGIIGFLARLVAVCTKVLTARNGGR